MGAYATILAAIDAAILAGVSGPGEIESADGRRIKYQSLADLLALQKHYLGLEGATSGTGLGVQFRGIEAGSGKL